MEVRHLNEDPLFGSFPKQGDPNMDPKYQDPYYRDSPKKRLILGNPHIP